MDNKITPDRISEENVFKNIGDSAEKELVRLSAFNKVLAEISQNSKKILEEKMDPKNTEQIEKQKKAIVDITEAEKLHQKVQKQKVELEQKIEKAMKATSVEDQKKKIAIQEQNKLNKELAKDQLGLISQYQKASKQLNDMRNAYKELTLAGRENGMVGKMLLKNITEQDEKLKGLDGTVGQHQRNVGNYTGAIKNLSSGLSGVTGILASIGQALGVDTSAIERAEQVSKTLAHASREISHAKHLEHLSHKENAEAIVQEGEAAVEANEGMSLLKMGLIGLVAGGIAFGIYELIKTFHLFGVGLESASEKAERLKKELEEQAKVGKLDQQSLAEYKEALIQAGMENYELEKATAEANEELRKQKKALEDISKFGREELSAEEIGKRLKTGMNVGSIATTELSDAVTKLEDQIKNFTEDKAAGGELNRLLQEINDKRAQGNISEKTAQDLREKAINGTAGRVKVAREENATAKEYLELIEKEIQKREHHTGVVKKEREEVQKLVDVYQKGFDKAEEMKLKKVSLEGETDGQAEFEARLKNIEDAKKLAKEKHDKELEDAFKTAKEIDTILGDAYAERNKMQQNALKQQEDNISDALTVQADLMGRGQQNTYSAELRAKQENQQKQRDLDKKAAKEKKALQLAEIVLEYTKVYAKDGWAGLGKAVAATALSEVAAEVFAGSAYDGTADTGGKGAWDGKGGKPWLVHPNEAIIPARRNKENPGLAQHWIDGTVDDYFKDTYLPHFIGADSAETRDLAIMQMVGSKMDAMRKAYEDRPYDEWGINKLDELFRRRYANGTMVETHYKKRDF